MITLVLSLALMGQCANGQCAAPARFTVAAPVRTWTVAQPFSGAATVPYAAQPVFVRRGLLGFGRPRAYYFGHAQPAPVIRGELGLGCVGGCR